MIRMCVLSKKTGRTGKDYFIGHWGMAKVLMFPIEGTVDRYILGVDIDGIPTQYPLASYIDMRGEMR